MNLATRRRVKAKHEWNLATRDDRLASLALRQFDVEGFKKVLAKALAPMADFARELGKALGESQSFRLEQASPPPCPCEPEGLLGKVLLTRDGRQVGNALVIDQDFDEHTGKLTVMAMTDYGNALTMSEDEMKSMFWPPEPFRPGHKYADMIGSGVWRK